jgi:hypothetical protein
MLGAATRACAMGTNRGRIRINLQSAKARHSHSIAIWLSRPRLALIVDQNSAVMAGHGHSKTASPRDTYARPSTTCSLNELKKDAYSAASRTIGSASTLAAQNLNSGILPNGSSLGLVSRFAAAST